MDDRTLEQIKEQYADYIAGLNDDDKAKVNECKTIEELNALIRTYEGELPDEVAEAVAGGKGDDPKPCAHWDDYTYIRRIADAKDEKDNGYGVQYLEFVCRNCWATMIKRKGVDVVVVKNWFRCNEYSYLDAHYNGYGGVR